MKSLSARVLSLALTSLSLGTGSARGCAGEGHDHVHTKRAFPQIALPAPTRPLVWGDVNVIHTTDTHGWLLGHQKASFPEPNYSADFGDFASFVTHMKALAEVRARPRQIGAKKLTARTGERC